MSDFLGIPSNSPESPFDDTRCSGCSKPFGLRLEDAMRSKLVRDLCVDCEEEADLPFGQYHNGMSPEERELDSDPWYREAM